MNTRVGIFRVVEFNEYNPRWECLKTPRQLYLYRSEFRFADDPCFRFYSGPTQVSFVKEGVIIYEELIKCKYKIKLDYLSADEIEMVVSSTTRGHMYHPIFMRQARITQTWSVLLPDDLRRVVFSFLNG